MVELAVPRFVRAVLLGGGADLRLDRVEQPGAADQLFVAVGEDLEAEHVDRDVALAQVGDDALGAGVERGRDDDDLVAFVERILVQCLAEALLEILGEVLAGGEAAVDRGDVLGAQFLDPTGVVQRLGDDITRRLVALEFDQHQRAIGGDGQEVDAPAETGVFLPADQHPLVGEQPGGSDDHVFQLLFAGQLRFGQGLGVGGDLPEVGTDGHGGGSGSGGLEGGFDQGGGEAFLLCAGLGEAGLEAVDQGQQFIYFGDDAVLFGEGWEGNWQVN